MTEFERFKRRAERLFESAAAVANPPNANLVQNIVAETRQDLVNRFLGSRHQRWVLAADNVASRAWHEINWLEAEAPELWQAIRALAGFCADRPSFFDLDAELETDASTPRWRKPAWSLTLITDPLIRGGRPPSVAGSFHSSALFDLLGERIWWIAATTQIADCASNALSIVQSADWPIAAMKAMRGLPAPTATWGSANPERIAEDPGLFALSDKADEPAVRAILAALADTPASGLSLVDRASVLCVGPERLHARLGLDIDAVLATPDMAFGLWHFEGGV